MVTALTSKLWDIVNSSSTYNFAENPLPVFFMLYAKKHGLTFSFDEEKKCVYLNGVDQLDEVTSCMVKHLSENSMQDIQSDIEMFKALWEEVLDNPSISHFHYQVIDHLINDYAITTNTPILSNDIQSLVHNAVVAFYNNYSISDKEDEEDKKNPHWIDWYNFIDCQEYDKSKVFSFYLMNLVRRDADSEELQLEEIKKVQEAQGYGGTYSNENVSLFYINGPLKCFEVLFDIFSEDSSYGATLCFNKEFCKTAEFLEWSKKIVEKNLVNFVIDLPPLNENHSGLLLVGINKSSDYAEERQVISVNGAKALTGPYTIDWDLIKRNLYICNDFSEWKGEPLGSYFRPDMLMGDERDNYYNLLPTWPNDLTDDKELIELSDIFEVVPSSEKQIYNCPCISWSNFSDDPTSSFKEFKEVPRDSYKDLVSYEGKSLILTLSSGRLQICKWNSESLFRTHSSDLVLRLKEDSPISLDYAIYAMLKSSMLESVVYNMEYLVVGNWHNFLKCQIAIHKDKAKQEEIVENLRNEYAHQRQKELEAEMQRLGIRTASSDMVHMLGPTFAKIESTLYDLKSEELTATAQGAVEALNDNVSYIKRFIKMAGADIMLSRMSMKERKVNEVISSIQKSWANLSSSRIFEVSYQSGVSDDVTFKIDESYFRVLFDTLFDNAYRHGFGKRSAVGNQVCISSQLVQKNRKEYVLLTVANNGEPFPEDFTPQKFISRGEYCGETGRTGLGGNHIYSILKRHDGFLNVTHNAEWNCIFEMLIPVAFQNDVESKNVCEYGNSSKCL